MTSRQRQHEAGSIAELMANVRNDYDAAKQSRFKRKRTGVSPTGSHADYHYRTWRSYAGIMETSRDLFRNHALIGQGVRRLVSNVLRGGFTLDVKTGDKGLDDALAARWKAWSEDCDQCDIQGENNFHAIERLVLQSVVVDGDILSLLTDSGSIQMTEGHRLRTPNNTKRNVIHGVLLDQHRKRLEYWITKENLSLFAPCKRVSEMVAYPARRLDEMTGRDEREVLHHYMPDRVTQTRGLTAFAPVIDTAGMSDDLMFATLVKAQMSACVTIFREMSAISSLPGALGGDGQSIEVEERPDGTTRKLAGWQPGMEIFGFPGEKLMGFSPNVPNAEFFEHAMLLLSIVAVNLDLPVAVFMLDPSNTNFSGWRGAIDQARQRFQEIQRWLIGSLHQPLYRWKVRQWATEDNAIRNALMRTVKGGEGASVDVFGHKWHAQEWPYIEPVKDAQGDLIQTENLQISRRRQSARRGMDYDDLVAEIVEDNLALIRRAHEGATKLGEELGIDITWQQALSPVKASGTLSAIEQPTSDSEASDDQSNDGPPNRAAALRRINGHGN